MRRIGRLLPLTGVCLVVAAVLAAVGVPRSLVGQGDSLSPSDELALTGFGTSVAISGDGSTAVVGGPDESAGRGAVWLFTRSASGWQQQGPKLVGASQARSFGREVALSGQGDVALISSDGVGNAPATLVYTRSGGTWSQVSSLPFATDFAISQDGGTLLLGMAIGNVGEARIYVRSGPATWTQQGPVLPGGDGYSLFGSTVALSADGSTAVVTTAQDNSPSAIGFHRGTVWTFARSGSTWTQQGPKLYLQGIEEFGESLSLSADGSRLVVSGYDAVARQYGGWTYERSSGGWGDPTRLATDTGAVDLVGAPKLSADGTRLLAGLHPGAGPDVFVRVLTRSGGVWAPEGIALGPGGGPTGGNGSALAFSADGGQALVASPGSDARIRTVTAYNRDGAAWTQNGPHLRDADTNGFSRAGYSVALSADGSTALVGGPYDGNTLNSIAPPGAVWVYARSGTSWTEQMTLRGCDIVGLGRSVALAADGNTAFVAGSSGDAACVFTRADGVWSTGTRLAATTTPGGGSSVALSPDGTVAVLGSPGAGTSGQVRLFRRTASGWAQAGLPLTGSDALAAAGFGAGVAISADAATLVVGGPSDDGSRGAVWTFARTSADGWAQDGPKLTGNGISGGFGSAVALSSDGHTALVGMSGRSIALAYARSGSSWVAQGDQLDTRLPNGSRRSGIEFGASVALDGSATTALVGAPQANEAWLFTRSGTTWTRADTPFTGSGDFGRSVSLTPNSLAAIVGSPTSGNSAGTASVYVGQPVPGRPTGVVASAGDGRATVSFDAPAPNGGAIDSYTVTASPGGRSATGPASPVELTGLTNGATYTFTVRANNTSGSGTASAPSNAVAPGAPPDAPTDVAAVAADGFAIVSFTPPTTGDGSPILYYTVTAEPGGVSVNGLASPIRIDGLENGTSYTFTVTATNWVGPGHSSAASAPCTPLEGPGRSPATPTTEAPRPAPPTSPAVSATARPPRPTR